MRCHQPQDTQADQSRVLHAEQVVRGAPFQIFAADLDTPTVMKAVGRKGSPCRITANDQLPMFPDT